ncbi:AraC-like ligand binding domain protein [Limosilactobacillus antri DSM 16041]|uniref:AraC-like ligand binding domain protein n=2 Tax=Limosilactobacillus antri TaxID=227943 RepID=C8P4A9_9LACO|nr:AraC-like ligand binding domain protein [Limosilactobacillus antri DSM 16041]KRK60698.1 raffinose operon transcriptional regulatory protein RafR [Limosilactobacillus antri DSM 16041]
MEEASIMDSEFKNLNTNHLESNVLFIGQDSCPPNYFFRGNNVRSNYVLHYILAGQGTFSSANRPAVSLKRGDVFLLPKDVPCFYQADGQQPWTYLWIGFTGTKIKTMLDGSKLGSQRYLRQVQDSQFSQYLNRLYDTLKCGNSLANDILAEALTYQMFYQLVTEFPGKASPTGGKAQQHLQLAQSYLEQNYRYSTCTVARLCEHLGLSRSYLYTIFKKGLTVSPQGYLTRLRMEEARQLLRASTAPVREIASGVGYHDEFTFSKAFKRYTGFSPSAYRQTRY